MVTGSASVAAPVVSAKPTTRSAAAAGIRTARARLRSRNMIALPYWVTAERDGWFFLRTSRAGSSRAPPGARTPTHRQGRIPEDFLDGRVDAFQFVDHHPA